MSEVPVRLPPPLPARSPPGARCSPADVAALLAGAALTLALDRALVGEARWLVGAPAAALGHFFLFCNLVRVRRAYELLWTAAFLLNVLAWTLLRGAPSWPGVLVAQAPLTLLAVAAELRSPEYHGVLWSRLRRRDRSAPSA